jgi:hypothetical protein
MKRARPELWGTWRGKKLDKRGEDWKIAELAASGASDLQIATQMGLQHGQAAGARRRKLGFFSSRKPRFYSHGQTMSVTDLRSIARDLGKSLRQLSDDMGVKYDTLKKGTSPSRLQEPLSSLIGRAFKKQLTKWRAEYTGRSATAQGGAPRLLLPSERQMLPREYHALLPDVKATLRWLGDRQAREQPARFEDLRDHVYLEARRGRLRKIALWPDLIHEIREVAAADRRLLRGELKPSDLTRTLLARTYGVSVETIRRSALSPA